jgi:hypothetical protein
VTPGEFTNRTVVASPVAAARRIDDHTILASVLDDDAARDPPARRSLRPGFNNPGQLP